MNFTDRLFQISDKLNDLWEIMPTKQFDAMERVAKEASRAWSGSWLGYHSRVYYTDLRPIPPGARFSKEWGLMRPHANEGTIGEWSEYDFQDLVRQLKTASKVKSLPSIKQNSEKVKNAYENFQAEALSIFSSSLNGTDQDSFLRELIEKVRAEKIHSYTDFIKFSGQPGSKCRETLRPLMQDSRSHLISLF